jgi:predicted glutamine amidotransferase
MCRFLLLASREPYDVRQIALQFAEVCRHSTSPEGDRQEDGWGVAWWHECEGWQRHRSLAPIWTETQVMYHLPRTCHMVVHARSASFARHKGQMAYNQPYTWNTYAFVFNGRIKGVRLPRRIPGKIGAQKLWHLVREQLRQQVPPEQALAGVYTSLKQHSREIQACNMGLSNGQDIVSYNGNPSGASYYQLHYVQQEGLKLISSEAFGTWAWRP